MNKIIALRFRDTDSRVDTITEHQAILKNKGRVWWGWWRKDSEPDIADQLALLAATSISLYLADPSTSRLFKCKCSSIKRTLPKTHMPLVPRYYRNEKSRVTAWFLFTSIRDISDQFGDFPTLGPLTLYWLRMTSDGSLELIDLATSGDPSGSGLTFTPELLHVSDLHYGADHAFGRPGRVSGLKGAVSLADAVIMDSARIRIKGEERPIICLTGDIATKGDWSNQFTRDAILGLTSLAQGLKVNPKDMLLIPGNHDMERYVDSDPEYSDPDAFHNPAIDYKHERAFRQFRANTTGESSVESLSIFRRFKTSLGFEVHIAGMNSCRITSTQFTEYGWVGEDELLRIFESFERLRDVSAIRILALHHHVVPLSDILTPNKQGISLTLDAGPVLRAAQRAGIRLVLHGHQHLPAVSKFAAAYLSDGSWRGLENEDLFVVSAGSAGSKLLPNGVLNSYTYLRFHKDRTEVRIRQLRADGSESGELAQIAIPIQPCVLHSE